MFEKLVSIIANELSVSKADIQMETHLQDDLGADSLDAVELLMSIEEAFNIAIPDSEYNNLKTVGDLLRFIEKNQ
ncbi:MAG: acyl carrier protein [Candidatus Izemoplasmatales bacterium]|jgi:acyl carrier protein|nr:acyl carrier protein [Candidatus Izemoplasmatales bacterium]NLF48754.1 acyl carrier protein [Acholeplasmataceae bacterium]MDD4354526.1 acyl carrier protein [Candidatus Izemoplasmatales bacterium]MDD4987811.1 acyl carrier protein [Candidatus Izemoplasmatales bacterium]MDD5602136.1 acyl carrier protein [Candidatus Izemoplasmatales bacterium]